MAVNIDIKVGVYMSLSSRPSVLKYRFLIMISSQSNAREAPPV